MLTRFARVTMAAAAALFIVVGVPLFAGPSRMAPVFPWRVSSFVTMTIGAWCLGNAWLAGVTVYRRDWRLVHTACLYLGVFGVTEIAVVLAFRERLVLDGPLAWLYLASLVVCAVAGGVGYLASLRLRRRMKPVGHPISRAQRSFVVAFVLFVGFLATYGMVAKPGAAGTNGGIFPEVLSAFTLRSFAAFYLSLSLAVVPLLFERSLPPLLHHSFASYGLIVAITLAALANIHLFDFVNRPGGLLYIGAYLAVGIPVGLALLKLGTGSLSTEAAATAAADG